MPGKEGRQAAVLLLYIVIAADETPILKWLNFADLKSGRVEKIKYYLGVL